MENSLAAVRPEIVTEWSPRNFPLSLEDISYGSKKVYWWKGKCGHEWEARAKARSQGEKCPICSGKRIIPGTNDLASLMPDLAAEWSPRNPMPAETVGIGSHKKAVWKGTCGHTWKDKIYNRTIDKAGCIYCAKEYKRSLPRQIILRYAEQLGVEVLFDNADTTDIPLDVYIPSLKLAVVFTKRWTEKEKRIIAIQEFLCHTRGIECKVIPNMDDTEVVERIIKAMMRQAKEA